MDTIMDNHYNAIFSGTPEEVRDHLIMNPPSDTELVRYGDSGRVVYATEYLTEEPA